MKNLHKSPSSLFGNLIDIVCLFRGGYKRFESALYFGEGKASCGMDDISKFPHLISERSLSNTIKMSQSDIRYGKNSNSRHHRIPTGNSRKDENILIKSIKSPSDDDLDCRARSSDFDVGTKMIYGNFIEINGLLDVNVSLHFLMFQSHKTRPSNSAFS